MKSKEVPEMTEEEMKQLKSLFACFLRDAIHKGSEICWRILMLEQKDWDDLYHERISIMVESGMLDSIAREKAWMETVKRFGPRPTGGNNGRRTQWID